MSGTETGRRGDAVAIAPSAGDAMVRDKCYTTSGDCTNAVCGISTYIYVMSFNLRLVRVFLAIAHRGNITQAAADLGVSQPSVSRSVRELERQTRATLLERTPSGVRLTDAGHALLNHARNIVAEARAAEEDLEALAGLTQGTLRVGGSPTIATYFIPPILQAFHSRYPGVELRLTSAPSRAIARLLAEREIDVALVETPVDDFEIAVNGWAEDRLW